MATYSYWRTEQEVYGTVESGASTVYGTVAFVPLTTIGVESGGIKDFVTGLLGTGRGRVAGTVKEQAIPTKPVYCKVRLIRERDGLQVRELWTNPVTGAYSFDYIDELQNWTVLSYYPTGIFRAVVADRLTPTLI